jgi:hypothetical protein
MSRSKCRGAIDPYSSPGYRLELHLDADEGNAAGLHPGDDTLLAEIDAKTTPASSDTGLRDSG